MNNSALVCLIHGHGVDASIWEGIYADLISNHRVLTPDFSRLTNLTTIDAYATELHDRLTAENVQHVVLVGHSMGGYIALAFAEKYPAFVQGLVLYHSTAIADDDKKQQARHQAVEALDKDGTAPFIEKQLPKMVALSYPAHEIERLIKRFSQLSASALAAGMEAMARRPDRTAVLKKAHFPVLLVLGEEDQLIPLEKTAKLAELSHQIAVETIANAGHLSMIEQPEASVRVLRSFLARI